MTGSGAGSGRQTPPPLGAGRAGDPHRASSAASSASSASGRNARSHPSDEGATVGERDGRGTQTPASPPPDALVAKRSLSIAGHRTSISLEEPFWECLRRLAAIRGMSVQRLVGEIDAGRGRANLSSAIRVAVLAAALSGSLHDGTQNRDSNEIE